MAEMPRILTASAEIALSAPEDVMRLYPLLASLEVAFPWRQGDLMILDNFYTFHGRNPYTGHRDVQVALLG